MYLDFVKVDSKRSRAGRQSDDCKGKQYAISKLSYSSAGVFTYANLVEKVHTLVQLLGLSPGVRQTVKRVVTIR